MTKILLVEDDKSLREIYGVRLLAEGYDIVSAGDGEEALAMAIKDRPDLIVSDVMMPKISGFDMLDILRSTTETKGIKVIMMTALSSEDQRQRGVALGADRYLVKSQVGIEDVVRTVHEVLGDAPVTSSSGGFSTTPTAPVATPIPAPAPMPAPVAAAQPAPQVQAPAPAMPAPAPVAPTLSPAPGPVAPQPPLPQPTAPFSTPRPSNLGDRIIHPLTSSEPPKDFAGMMNDELTAHVEPAPAPFVPPTPPTPAPEPTAAVEVAMPSLPPPPPTPASPPAPVVPEPSGLNFEETPVAPAAPNPNQSQTPGV